MLIEELRDHLQLFGMLQIEPVFGEMELNSATFAHAGLASFSVSRLESMALNTERLNDHDRKC